MSTDSSSCPTAASRWRSSSLAAAIGDAAYAQARIGVVRQLLLDRRGDSETIDTIVKTTVDAMLETRAAAGYRPS